MALFKKGGAGGAEEGPKQIWESFFKLVMKNDWNKSLDLLNKLKEHEPRNPQVYMKMGDILQRMGDSQGAMDSYHQAANLLVDAGEVSKALAIYKIILRLNPSDEDAANRSRELMGAPVQRQESNLTYEQVAESGEAEQELQPAEEYQQQYEEPSAEPPAQQYEEPAQAPAPEPATVQQAPAPQAAAEKPKTLNEALQRHPIFSVLNPDDIDMMIKKAAHRVFKQGEAVINEDEPGASMFIIKKGKAQVTSTILEKKFDLAVLGGGQFFGEVGFMTGMPRTATVAAISDLAVMEIDKPLLQEIIDRNPRVLQKLVELSRARSQDKMDKMKGE
jgi:tetratricopeptide (TPR) repeat protein